MTTLDATVIVISLFFVIRGFLIGFVRQLATLLALSVGFLAAGHYYNKFSIYITEYIKEPQLAFIVTYALLFALTYVAVILLGILLKKLMQVSLLGWFDRMLGVIFGFAKSAFICTLLFMAAAWILSSTNPLIQKSFFSKYLMQSSEYVTSLLDNKELQKKLTPRQPAISAFLSDPVKFLQFSDGKTK